VPLSGAFGVPLRDPDGDGRLGQHRGHVSRAESAHIDTDTGKVDHDVSLPQPFFPVALAGSRRGLLAVAGDLGNSGLLVGQNDQVLRSSPSAATRAPLEFSPDRIFSLRPRNGGASFVDVAYFDIQYRHNRGRQQPLSPVGVAADSPVRAPRRLAANERDALRRGTATTTTSPSSTSVRTRSWRACRFPLRAPMLSATSPNALALDGDRLLRPRAVRRNAIAVFRVGRGDLTPLGAIPTGLVSDRGGLSTAAHGVLYIADGQR